jgi:hypothetical protein
MSKEQSPDLKEVPEAELRTMLKQAEFDKDYRLQLRICQALLPFEERPCLALTAIKELKELLVFEPNPEEKLI